MNEHKKNLIKLIEKAAYRFSTWEVFSDFIEMAAISISNSIDLSHYVARENKYMEIIKKYTKEEIAIFPKLLGETVEALEENITDVLGNLFMELDLGSNCKGQFFTPYNLCKLTCEVSSSNIDKEIRDNGYIELNEPCVGGGAMVIAFAETMKNKGYNPQRQLKVICQDLDLKAVHMSYIQLSLLGIPAIVFHGNTLSLETYSVWETPSYILGGWWYRRQKEPKEKVKAIELQLEKNGQYSMLNFVG